MPFLAIDGDPEAEIVVPATKLEPFRLATL